MSDSKKDPNRSQRLQDETPVFKEVKDIHASMEKSVEMVRRDCAEQIQALKEVVAQFYPGSEDKVAEAAIKATAAFGVAAGNPAPTVELISEEFDRGLFQMSETDFILPTVPAVDGNAKIAFFEDPLLQDEVGLRVCEMAVRIHQIIGEMLAKRGKEFQVASLQPSELVESLKSVLRLASRSARERAQADDESGIIWGDK